MDLKTAKKIHFVGIGGIGTSSLAQILFQKGKKISGSDNIPSKITEHLKKLGIKVFNEHKTENVPKKCDLLIYSPAIPKSNPEIVQAKKQKIKCLSYPEALGELSDEYFLIAIAGAHGKSTTTAMMSLIAIAAGMDPTIVIGTKMQELNDQNFRVGKSEYMIIEACEYMESFLKFTPQILIITNIEADHLDYYKTFENYKKAFERLAKKVPKNGTVIINKNDKIAEETTKNIQATVITNEDISYAPKVPGVFNIENASMAAKTAKQLGISEKTIKKAIIGFNGTWRRMQHRQIKGISCPFIDDYGHHPTEIRATLKAIRDQHKNAKILCVFQPHQYSRTRLLLKDFGKAFTDADEVIIPNIYRVRDTEKDVKSISTDDLVNEILKHQKNVKNGHGLTETAQFIKENHKNYDLIVTMGAGNIDNIYEMLQNTAIK